MQTARELHQTLKVAFSAESSRLVQRDAHALSVAPPSQKPGCGGAAKRRSPFRRHRPRRKCAPAADALSELLGSELVQQLLLLSDEELGASLIMDIYKPRMHKALCPTHSRRC